MTELKTKVNDASVEDFLNSVPDLIRRKDSFTLLKIYQEITEQAKMWGTSIIGFGKYHYKSERSSQEGDWPLAAFSPRKQSLTLYVDPENFPEKSLFEKLGKSSTSKACLYINKLSDVDVKVLREIIEKSYLEAKKRFKS